MNVVCLVGRLIADPEIRKTTSGTDVCSFAISVNRSTKGDDGYFKTDLIRCTAWKNTAAFVAKYFHKGNNIGVNGTIQVDSYTDKETGKKLSSFTVVAQNVYFVEKAAGVATPASKADSVTSGFKDFVGMNEAPIMSDEGDLPF